MENFFFDIGIVVVFSALLAWVALFFRQPIIIAYIFCGILIGPWGLSLVKQVDFVDRIAHIGIPLLLFLAGLDLKPRHFAELLKNSWWQTLGSCFLVALISSLFAFIWGFDVIDSLFLGQALMFSSTILVVKLLPTTTLHQKMMGAFCIAILIAQDVLAVGVLMMITSTAAVGASQIFFLAFKGVLLLGVALLVEQFFVRRMMEYCDQFHETLYLLSLAWCMGVAMLAKELGFSYEVGAFIAGMTLARSPIALFLAQGLKFFRDFFLVLFFFVLGARLDLFLTVRLLWPAVLLGIFLVIVKPLVFSSLFQFSRGQGINLKEASVRLGQASEFSLIIAIMAYETGYVTLEMSQFIQLTTIVTMIVSSYRVVYAYPTPLGVMEKLHRD